MVCIKNMNRKILKISVFHTFLNFSILILYTHSIHFYDNTASLDNFYDFMNYGPFAVEYMICCSTLFYIEKDYILLRFSDIKMVQWHYAKNTLIITTFYIFINYLPKFISIIKQDLLTPDYFITFMQKVLAYLILGEILLILFFKGFKLRFVKVCVGYLLAILLLPGIFNMYAFYIIGNISDCIKLIIIY